MKLEYKYFPESRWGEEVRCLSYVYQSPTRQYSSFDYCNINPAYMELSGRYNRLIDVLFQTGLHEVNTGYMGQLHCDIMEGKREFDIRASYNRPEGLAEINIPICQTGNTYGVEMYTVEYTPLPEIEHGIYNNIDTKLQEQQLKMLMPTTFLSNLKNQLLFGETAETRSHASNQILVRADPENKTLRVFDKDKK